MKQNTYIHTVTGEEIKYFAGEIPFRDGKAVAHATKTWEERTNPEGKSVYDWKPNAPFHKAVTFTGFERGRSAAHAMFRETYGTEKYPGYTMFLTDLSDLIVGEVNINHFEGIMAYTKRGQNYGFKLLELTPFDLDR